MDNGLDGGIAFVNEKVRGAVPMPVIGKKGLGKREYDLSAIVELLKKQEPTHAFIEKAQAMPGQGVSSMFSIGKGYGCMIGVCAGLGIPYTLVHPKTWQKVMFLDLPKADTKALSLIVCQRLFPSLSLKASDRCSKAHDGMTDALCIAEYGRRLLSGT